MYKVFLIVILYVFSCLEINISNASKLLNQNDICKNIPEDNKNKNFCETYCELNSLDNTLLNLSKGLSLVNSSNHNYYYNNYSAKTLTVEAKSNSPPLFC